MGFEDTEQSSGGALAKSIGLHTFGSLLIAFVLVHSILVWQPETWEMGENQAMWVYGLIGAIWTWGGFCIPLQITPFAWEIKGRGSW